jgi:hypothetical protein
LCPKYLGCANLVTFDILVFWEIPMKKSALFITLGVTAIAFASYEATNKLFYNGKVASTNVKMIGGKAYVPLDDVAKAMQMTVKKRSGGFEIIREGGSHPIADKNVGKIGDWVFTGKWRFQVVSVEHADDYQVKYTEAHDWTKTEAKSNMELVIVKCKVKNGTTKKDTLVFGKWDGNNTSLTSTDEDSYGYDVKASEHFPDGASFIPGATINFNLIFEVPKRTKVKDLIFTAMRYDDRASFDQKKRPPTDIRIVLGE